MKSFFSLLIFVSCLSNALIAGPAFDPDLSSYINDAELEPAPLTIKEKKRQLELEKREQKKAAVKKEREAAENARNTEKGQSSKVKTNTQNGSKFKPAEEEGSPIILILGLAAVVLAAIVAYAFVSRKKGSAPSVAPSTPAPPTPAEKMKEQPTKLHTPAPKPKPQPKVHTPTQPAPPPKEQEPEENNMHETTMGGHVDISAATSVDSSGRNPSGIIIDEDKYFASKNSGSEFVDEDFRN